MIKTKEDYNSNSILELGNLIKVLTRLRGNGAKIGLCVGAFDLLHAGHINHFISAKKHCNVLVVGITSDKYVSQRKSKGRPIFNEQVRAFSASQIKPVDYVFISDYKTANEVIILTKPDFYIKGPDYKKDMESDILSERESIQKVGGSIVYTEDEKLSSSEIITHIRNLEE